MNESLSPITPPVDGLSCRSCGDPIVATDQVHTLGALSISGFREYRWSHSHGSDVCRPKTAAQPFDGWRATSHVEAVLAERAAAEDALLDALEGQS